MGKNIRQIEEHKKRGLRRTLPIIEEKIMYECPACKKELIKTKDGYECINELCPVKGSFITIEEGYKDILVVNEDTEEVETANKFCITMDIKYKQL